MTSTQKRKVSAIASFLNIPERQQMSALSSSLPPPKPSKRKSKADVSGRQRVREGGASLPSPYPPAAKPPKPKQKI